MSLIASSWAIENCCLNYSLMLLLIHCLLWLKMKNGWAQHLASLVFYIPGDNSCRFIRMYTVLLVVVGYWKING